MPSIYENECQHKHCQGQPHMKHGTDTNLMSPAYMNSAAQSMFCYKAKRCRRNFYLNQNNRFLSATMMDQNQSNIIIRKHGKYSPHETISFSQTFPANQGRLNPYKSNFLPLCRMKGSMTMEIIIYPHCNREVSIIKRRGKGRTLKQRVRTPKTNHRESSERKHLLTTDISMIPSQMRRT